MNKYSQTLVRNIKKQLEIWLNEQELIQHREVYLFLHSIAKTASTIGFTEVGNMASSLVGQLDVNEEREWKKRDLQTFLLPLISIIYHEKLSNVDEIIGRKNELDDKKLILLIDEDTALLMLLKEELEKNHWVVIAVADPERAINYYYDLKPDCVVIDIPMKDKNGLDVLVQLKEKMKQQFIPSIMISSDQSKEVRMKSYKLGADDFIHKPLDIEEFIVRINRQLERKQAIDHVILIDELTRVYNRKYLSQPYDRLISILERRHDSFCMVLIDLDHFKKVNDTYGHITGDEVLATFADTLRSGLRVNDIIIRYGGEKFIILLPEKKSKEAKLLIEKILLEFSNIPFEGNDEEFFCTFSAGIHEVHPSETDLKKNIEITDGALYEAKQAGRNQVKIAAVNSLEVKRKPIHVAIVDDDPIIRTMLEDLISKSKVTEGVTLDIKVFKDGMEFIEAGWHLNTNERYLIILDGMMPRMDGLEVLQKLRGLQYQERFTVLMLTTRKSDHDISRALQLGADDYITKPFKLLELETRLGHLIKRMK